MTDTDASPGPVGIVEVAALAGVSPATVSRALRGIPGVSTATRQLVQKAAADLGYVASPQASALARGRTSAIGVLAPWISRWFFTAVIEGAQDVVTARGYDLLLYPLGANAGPDAQPVDTRGLHKRVDGVLGLNVPVTMRPATLKTLAAPLVTVGSTIPGVPGVRVDDQLVGYLAARHLIDLGHRRIAFLGLDPDDMYGFTVARDRHTGYCRALAEAGLPTHPADVEITGFAVEAGEAALEHQLAIADWDPAALPTAIVAVSDEVAMGVLYAARHRGIRVPQDLSVVGVDNHDLSHLFDLTTVGQPVRQQGAIAAQMLLDLIDGRGVGGGEPVRLLEPGLVVRNTTAPPRAH
ncbi:LacI family DNA-binding transcriptional regulator [Nakamurella sp. YIM 132087]|uniref:LacI family DNA-binding transcriptional regulator n=1 Tax=Nakamurella alba TaxID=2665158 RepID=A0A7K1FRN0_9ACTN|nr:LacI family DNA-binding transcriptional regulator [Nakamurella alba]MTD16019.1 LacI family DNA-binding transcriptional regulator [Nakamurella alba]